MSQEFVDWADWSSILDYVFDELFPPTFLVLLEDHRCQHSGRGLKAIVSAKNIKALIADLEKLDKDIHTEDVARWLRHTNMTFEIVMLEAIEAIKQRADSLEGERPTPLNGWEVVRFCLQELLESSR